MGVSLLLHSFLAFLTFYSFLKTPFPIPVACGSPCPKPQGGTALPPCSTTPCRILSLTLKLRDCLNLTQSLLLLETQFPQLGHSDNHSLGYDGSEH